ncbi:MAG TPA: hypothetical protein VNO14_15640 [Blastocatellia bacterium]|nr:hypothetical protein [Blastocatellia bacterium]
MTSLWLALWIAGETTRVSTLALQVETQIKRNQDEVERIKKEEEKRRQEELAAVMTQEDSFQLAAARRLIERKTLSWNKLLSDIEGYVPEKARVTSIKVNEILEANESAAAAIEIKAVGETPAQMTEMMSRLTDSKGLFALGKSTQEQITESNEVPFTIYVTYRPTRGGAQ